jgi:ATP-dependent RNA helicase DDX23/PRP28
MSILDAMGGLLKSENETEAYEQEETIERIWKVVALPPSVVAIFCTMPLSETDCQAILAAPAVISIGDGFVRTRIVQRASCSWQARQKSRLSENYYCTSTVFARIIVFVNERSMPMEWVE